MESILSCLKGLHHRFSRSEISKSCELTLASLREHTLPAYTQAAGLFSVYKIASADGRSFANDFKRIAGGGNNMVVSILEALTNGQATLTEIDKKAESLFADQEASMALSYQKAAWLQLVSSITFANDYSRKFLNYLYVLETAQADKEVALETSITKAEREYVQQYFVAFATVIKVMLIDFKQIATMVAEMPDAVVSQLTEQTLPATLGPAKMNPLGLSGFSIPITISVKWNPFYLFGTMMAAFQVMAYKAAQEERDLLQMRKLNLEKIHEKRPDPKLQQEIVYLADRVSRLNYELQQQQEEYGV